MLGQHLLQFLQVIAAELLAGHARRRAVGVGGGHAERLEQQRPKRGVKLLDPADAHAAQRVAVIRLAEGDVAGLRRKRGQNCFFRRLRLGFGKGVRSLLCEAPGGPFRQKAPDPFSEPLDASIAGPF